MKIKVFNQNKEAIKEIELPKEIFEIETNSDLIHQVILVQRANRRQKTAKTKDRSEVRGGGKKPWRQKGTGRARHGSIRSPLWAGGGVTFGPNLQKNFKKTIPTKMRRKALFMVLSQKAKENFIFILEDLKMEKPKTKLMAEILNRLFLEKGSGLIALPEKDDNIIKSARNIEGVKVTSAKDLNVLDLLSYKFLLMPKPAIKTIKETFAGKSE